MRLQFDIRSKLAEPRCQMPRKSRMSPAPRGFFSRSKTSSVFSVHPIPVHCLQMTCFPPEFPADDPAAQPVPTALLRSRQQLTAKWESCLATNSLQGRTDRCLSAWLNCGRTQNVTTSRSQSAKSATLQPGSRATVRWTSRLHSAEMLRNVNNRPKAPATRGTTTMTTSSITPTTSGPRELKGADDTGGGRRAGVLDVDHTLRHPDTREVVQTEATSLIGNKFRVAGTC
jgi:hypothetical protein